MHKATSIITHDVQLSASALSPLATSTGSRPKPSTTTAITFGFYLTSRFFHRSLQVRPGPSNCWCEISMCQMALPSLSLNQWCLASDDVTIKHICTIVYVACMYHRELTDCNDEISS